MLKPFLFIFFIVILSTGFLFCGVKSNSSLINQDENIDCIIISIKSCYECLKKHQDFLEPFHNTYQDNIILNFAIIDFHDDPNLMEVDIQRLSFDMSLSSDFSCVIFSWGGGKVEVLDQSHLDSIESTFFNILEDINNNSLLSSLIESIDIELVISTVIITLIVILISLLIILLYKFQLKPTTILRRITLPRFSFVAILSFISFFALTYQFLVHSQFVVGDCGCPSATVTKAALFRQYDHIDLLGLEIPYALIGLGFMCAILIQTFLIGSLPIPLSPTLPIFPQITIDKRVFQYFYFFLVLQQILSIFVLIYLLYIELFVIEMVCILCTVSQIVIILNTGLIVTWKPFT